MKKVIEFQDVIVSSIVGSAVLLAGIVLFEGNREFTWEVATAFLAVLFVPPVLTVSIAYMFTRREAPRIKSGQVYAIGLVGDSPTLGSGTKHKLFVVLHHSGMLMHFAVAEDDLKVDEKMPVNTVIPRVEEGRWLARYNPAPSAA